MLAAAVLAAATAGLLAARCPPASPLPRVEPGYRETPMVFVDLAEQDDAAIVAALAAYPDVLFGFDTENLRPIGHPHTSAADCGANPGSLGCRIASIRALAAAQGVDAARLCMSFRFDVYRKWPGWDVDTIDGVPFDPDWVVRIPGDEHEADVAQFRGGLEYRTDLDGAWVESLEDACCHDAVAGNCTASDRCALRYGIGDDVRQTFRVANVAVDLRSPEVRSWSAGRLIAQLDDIGADCTTLGIKTGRWQWTDGTPNAERCFVPGSHQWFGPVQPFDPCAGPTQPLSMTPYGPGDWEAAMNDALLRIAMRLHREGREGVRIVTVEKPNSLPAKWAWMTDSVSSLAYLEGELGRSLYPFGRPPPATSALLWPPPQGGLAPLLGVDLGVEAGGGTQGAIDYHVWCDCTSKAEDPAVAKAHCGAEPGAYYEVLGTAQRAISLPDACDYPDAGKHYPKAIVVRGGDADEDRIALDVD